MDLLCVKTYDDALNNLSAKRRRTGWQVTVGFLESPQYVDARMSTELVMVASLEIHTYS
jgi:hypothetical protein